MDGLKYWVIIIYVLVVAVAAQAYKLPVLNPIKSANNPTETQTKAQLLNSGCFTGRQLTMSYAQALLLAQEESKCLHNFGIQDTISELFHFPTNTFLQSENFPRFHCGYPSSVVNSSHFDHDKCVQCRSLTARPIRSVMDCLGLCSSRNDFCSRSCFQLYASLQRLNDVKADNFSQSVNVNIKNRSYINNNNTVIIKETSTDFVGPLTLNQQGESEKKVRINSPEVFCETLGNPLADVDNERERAHPVPHFVYLKWRVSYNSTKEVLPVVFVIEQKMLNSSQGWATIGKTSSTLFKVNVSQQFYQEQATYKWRISGVFPDGIKTVATSTDFVKSWGYVNPVKPNKVFLVDMKAENSSVNALIGWEPSPQKPCFYKISVATGKSHQNHEAISWNFRIKDEPRGVNIQLLRDLSFDTVYDIQVTSRNLYWADESDPTRFTFKTPTCLESHNFSFSMCPPPPPQNVTSKMHIVRGFGLQFVVTWLHPLYTSESNQITKYLIHVCEFSLHRKKNHSVSENVVPGKKTKFVLRDWKPDKEYGVMITAFSKRGKSPPVLYLFNTGLMKEIQPSKSRSIKNDQYEGGRNFLVFASLGFIVTIVLTLFCNLLVCSIRQEQRSSGGECISTSGLEEKQDDACYSSGCGSFLRLPADTGTTRDSSTSSLDRWLFLFDQDFSREEWEISWKDLTLGKIIGQGAFGLVYSAKISRSKHQERICSLGEFDNLNLNKEKSEMVPTGSGKPETVAVKMLKRTRADNTVQFVKEIAMMQCLGFHPQLVALLGVTFTPLNNICLVLEYCPGGDLLSYARRIRRKYWSILGFDCASGNTKNTVSKNSSILGQTQTNDIGSLSSEDESWNVEMTPRRRSSGRLLTIPPAPPTSAESKYDLEPFDLSETDEDLIRPILENDVLSYARQICMGMDYLENSRIVHRDLACRNILLMDDFRRVKISDFGLSRDVYGWNIYHQKSSARLPIKWMAIESIHSNSFTSKSDVWSFGVLLWELATLGVNPYPGVKSSKLFDYLRAGMRMEKPENCSEGLYQIMRDCWRTNAVRRPSFLKLKRRIEALMDLSDSSLHLSMSSDSLQIPVDTKNVRFTREEVLVEMQMARTGKNGDKNSNYFPQNNGQRLPQITITRPNGPNENGISSNSYGNPIYFTPVNCVKAKIIPTLTDGIYKGRPRPIKRCSMRLSRKSRSLEDIFRLRRKSIPLVKGKFDGGDTDLFWLAPVGATQSAHF